MCLHFDPSLLFTFFISIWFLVGKNIPDFLEMHVLRLFSLESLLLGSCWWGSFFRERCPQEGESGKKREGTYVAALTCGSVLVNTSLGAHVAGLGFPLEVNVRNWTQKVCWVPENHFSPFSGTVDSNQSRQIVYLPGWSILLVYMTLMKTLSIKLFMQKEIVMNSISLQAKLTTSFSVLDTKPHSSCLSLRDQQSFSSHTDGTS